MKIGNLIMLKNNLVGKVVGGCGKREDLEYDLVGYIQGAMTDRELVDLIGRQRASKPGGLVTYTAYVVNKDGELELAQDEEEFGILE